MPWRSAKRLAGGQLAVLALVTFIVARAAVAEGHPLGNFSLNHYARIRVDKNDLTIRYVVDTAEISAFLEITTATGRASTSWSDREREAYLARTTARYVEGLRLAVDGAPVSLWLLASSLSTPPGVGGQPTLRVVSEIAGSIGPHRDGARFRFEDTNHAGRAGWHELVLEAGEGVEIFDSSAYASSLSDELRTYPKDVLMAPLQERTADWSVTSGRIPRGATPLSPRLVSQAPEGGVRERVTTLLTAPTLATDLALLGALLAVVLGSLQALAVPDGTVPDVAPPRCFRGAVGVVVPRALRVAMAEIAEVVPLALVALVAVEYVLPARFHPAVRITGGGTIGLIGASLLVHGTREPPRRELGTEGAVGFRPSASALVVLLAGIAFHRVGYGFVLIGAFSVGLAGMVIVRQLSLLDTLAGATQRIEDVSRWSRVLRALIITAVGAAICVDALSRARHF